MKRFFCFLSTLAAAGSAIALDTLPQKMNVPTTWAWYVSDSLGTQKETCAWYDQLSYPWTLAVRESDGVRWERLWKKKEEIWLIRWAFDSQHRFLREDVFRDGKPSETLAFDPTTERVSLWTEYRTGKPTLVHTLTWTGDVLAGQTVKNASGIFQYKDLLSYGTDGRLRRVEREALDGVVLASAAWTYGADGTLADIQTFSSQTSFRIRSGTKIEESLIDDVGNLTRRVWEQQPSGGQLETDLTDNGEAGAQKTFDSRGRLVREEKPESSGRRSVRTWTYDEKGRLVSSTSKVGDVLDETKIEWNSAGRVVTEWTDGFLLNRETWVGDERFKEEAFSKGTKVWEERWKDGKRIETVFFDGDEITRTVKEQP